MFTSRDRTSESISHNVSKTSLVSNVPSSPMGDSNKSAAKTVPARDIVRNEIDDKKTRMRVARFMRRYDKLNVQELSFANDILFNSRCMETKETAQEQGRLELQALYGTRNIAWSTFKKRSLTSTIIAHLRYSSFAHFCFLTNKQFNVESSESSVIYTA